MFALGKVGFAFSLVSALTVLATGCSSADNEFDDFADGEDPGGDVLEDSSEDLTALPGFVRTQGERFTLDGKPFYFQGTNAASLSIGLENSEQEIYDAMNAYAASGLRVVRIWGFSCAGQNYGASMIESLKDGNIKYNESALKRLDAVLDAARVAKIKIIIPFVNYEDAYCGMDLWADQVIGSKDRQTFYTDARVKSAFKQHVTRMLNRVNTKYRSKLGKSVRYRDDSTIMAIEMANEPHTQDNYEKSRGLKPGEIVYNWLSELSDHIRSVDSKHLLCSGEEGYMVSRDPVRDGPGNEWINNGLKGEDFERNIRLKNLDFVTVHIYPDNWAIRSSDMGSFVKKYLVERRADLAHAAGKPIVLEEAGFSQDPKFSGDLGYSSNPEKWLSQMYSFANGADYAGTMIWEMLPENLKRSGGYVYPPGSAVARVVTDQAKYMNRRSGFTPPPGSTGGGGSGFPTCAQGGATDPDGDGWGWENGKSCKVGSSTPPSTPSYPTCAQGSATDPDGDGWGWENGKTCKVGPRTSPPTSSTFPRCTQGRATDPDGDGWGFENGKSCRV